MKKAFLQVRVRENDRNALHFHWKQREHSNLETLRFTRALFGLVPSPFLLGGVIEHHLSSWETRKPEVVAEVHESLYVDDLLSGGATMVEAKDLKQQTITIFEDATFSLHKWHSNASELEEVPVLPVDKEETFAKQQLGKPNGVETSLLGLGWNKERDEISVSFPGKKADSTKRGVLWKLASIYDPLRLVSPVTLEGKLLFRAVCYEKNTWDAPLSTSLQLKWDKWENHLPEQDSDRRTALGRAQTTH